MMDEKYFHTNCNNVKSRLTLIQHKSSNDRATPDRLDGVKTFMLICLVTLGVLSTSSCSLNGVPKKATSDVQGSVRIASDAIVEHLRDRDFAGLATWVHPSIGIRFSPYAYVEPDYDRTLSADQLRQAGDDTEKYRWGVYDGSGYPIVMSIREYFDRFVYDVDFANAENVIYDKGVGRGNTINNAAEIYPGRRIVEYYLPGIDPASGGSDWRSLRLILRQIEDTWILEGLIHDEWTT